MKNISVIGVGELGAVFDKKLQAIGYKIKKYDINQIIPGLEKNIADALLDAEMVLICVPTEINNSIAKDVISNCREGTIVVSFSKGLNSSGQTASEIFYEHFEKKYPWIVVGGPMLAEEIGTKQAIFVLGSENQIALKEVSEIFSKINSDVETVLSPLAVSFAGVLKNIYAVGCGIGEKIIDDEALKKRLVFLSMKEMEIFFQKNNLDLKIVDGPAGRGDFLATAESNLSKNRTMGIEIATKGEIETKGEALKSGPLLLKRFSFIKEIMPLFVTITEIIERKKKPESLIPLLK
jgi:glycerol-3-phosphate dehydrogenase (NAD(P)+)